MPTNYVGEEYRIETRGETDFDGTTLTPSKVDHFEVEVFKVTDGALVSPPVVTATMTWDATIEHWVYIWDTTGLEAGTYKAFVTAVNLDLSLSIEGPKRIRLKVDPRP